MYMGAYLDNKWPRAWIFNSKYLAIFSVFTKISSKFLKRKNGILMLFNNIKKKDSQGIFIKLSILKQKIKNCIKQN